LRGIEPARVVRAAVSLFAETNGHRGTVEWKCESHFAGVT
jgi:hypothetical protein